MNKTLTPLQQAIKQFESLGNKVVPAGDIVAYLKSLLPEEKKQMEEMFLAGADRESDNEAPCFEDYYTNTYNNGK